MRVVMTIVGVLAVLLGGVWVLQGLNVLPGSFMTGDFRWAVYGALLAGAGLGALIWANRRRRSR